MYSKYFRCNFCPFEHLFMFHLSSNTSGTSECNTRVDSNASGACHAKLLEIQVGSHKCYSYRRKAYTQAMKQTPLSVCGQKGLTALSQHCTDMRRLPTAIRSEKCVFRRFRRSSNVYLHNLGSIVYFTRGIYGIGYCS